MAPAAVAPGTDTIRVAGLNIWQSGADMVGPPVLCLHGIGGDRTSFADQLGQLGGRRVIAWNMPGYGGSDPLMQMDFAALSGAVVALLDALGIATVHLVGQSIGGMIAQEVAIRSSDRVASLGLIATTPAFGGRDDSFRQAFVAARLSPLDAGADMATLAQQAIPAIIGPAASAEMRQLAIAAMGRIDETAFRQVVSCLVTFNRRADQHRISQPCCLIAGSHDTNSPARVMAKMADGLANATFHIVDQAGHLVNSECPETVNAILTAFFNRVENKQDG
ncbi:MAG: alpha/beta fold hydrolase [Candidatus Puniceispirillaceae bacterium]